MPDKFNISVTPLKFKLVQFWKYPVNALSSLKDPHWLILLILASLFESLFTKKDQPTVFPIIVTV